MTFELRTERWVGIKFVKRASQSERTYKQRYKVSRNTEHLKKKICYSWNASDIINLVLKLESQKPEGQHPDESLDTGKGWDSTNVGLPNDGQCVPHTQAALRLLSLFYS